MDGMIGAMMTKGAVNQLHETIKMFNVQSSKQTDQMLQLTNKMLWLTLAIAFLTLVMAIGVGFQIYFAVLGIPQP